jgi:hypothetical protein
MQTSAASIWQKANESELKELVAKLDGFYGPFLQMSEANFRMIKEFKKRHPEKPRTLTALFDEAWLSSLQDGDLKIISEVCQNAAVLEKFIAENAGMVDRQILPYLAAASAHFRFLRLAHEKQLGSDPTIFDKYVYPRSLDGVLRLEVERLMRRSDALRANPGRSPGLIEPLVIGSNLVLDAPEADAVWQADLPG